MNIGSNKYSTLVTDVDRIGPTDLTVTIEPPNNNKILFITSAECFDKFTEKYGYVKGDSLCIKWYKVAKDFRGVGIDNDLYEDRFLIAPYKTRTFASWWDGEYHIKNFCVFNKEEKKSKKSESSKIPKIAGSSKASKYNEKYLAPPTNNSASNSAETSSQSAESQSTESKSIDSSRSTESFKSIESTKSSKSASAKLDRKFLAPGFPNYRRSQSESPKYIKSGPPSDNREFNLPKPIKKPMNADFSDESGSDESVPSIKSYVHIEGEEDNCFFADRPSAAASKAYTLLLKRFEGRSIPNDIIINMQEVHKSKRTPSKIFTYQCNKEKLDPPEEITIKDEKTGQMKKGYCHSRNKIKLIDERLA